VTIEAMLLRNVAQRIDHIPHRRGLQGPTGRKEEKQSLVVEIPLKLIAKKNSALPHGKAD